MKISPGDLVKVNLGRDISPEGLQLFSLDFGAARLYEEISIESFPSWNDFNGYSNLFKSETLLVVGKKGRPLSFNLKENWDLYDVYVVMYNHKTYNCFLHCLEKVSDAKP